MQRSLYVNGRFLAQSLSGVQRFATEITAGLARHYPGELCVLAPRRAEISPLPVKRVGRHSGQAWEQIELPRHTKGGLLLNLGNTAPLRLRNQIVVVHDAGVFATPEAYSWKFRTWYKFAQAWLLRTGSGLVTVSEFSKRELVRVLGAQPEQIGVISEGADHMHDITADDGVLSLIPPGRFVLVVGTLAAHKNISALSCLAMELAARGISLVITGAMSGAPFQSAGSLPQPAHYIGRVSDGQLKALYERAACLVFPSRYEGFGLPAVEAMACGCPVVAARIPALLETCGDAAAFCDPASPADIAGAVLRLLNDAELEAQLRRAARSHVAAYTWQGAAAQLATLANLRRDVIDHEPGHLYQARPL